MKEPLLIKGCHSRRAGGWGLLVVVLVAGGPSFSQQGVVVENFRVVPERYPPPHEQQMKSLLEGRRAQPLPGGRVQVTEARLQTFRENGTVEMIVTTPVCEYEQSTRSVSSSEPIRVEAADGAFSIAGEGFLWRQTNSSFVISNRVVTVIQPNLLRAAEGGTAAAREGSEGAPVPAASPTGAQRSARPTRDGQSTGLRSAQSSGPVTIEAGRFSYDAETGLGTYGRHARVTSTNLLLEAETLAFKLPMREKQVESVTAEENVVLDYSVVLDGVHATGQKAVYSTGTGVLDVSGKPQWKAGQREGHADAISIDRSNRVFRATGDAFLRMPAQGERGAGFLGRFDANPAESVPAADKFVEVRCASYEFLTNRAEFRGPVHVVEIVSGQPRATLDCGSLTLGLSERNELTDLTARQDVRIAQDDKELRGGLAVYTAVAGVLEVTEKPEWRAGPREGRGDVVRISAERDTMSVEGNAWMRLPAGEFGQSLPFQGKETPPGAASRPDALADSFAEVRCREYELSPEALGFRGNVRVEHPQMKWQCDLVAVRIPSEPGEPRTVIAEPSVIFEVKDEKGQTVKGTGDRAVFTQVATLEKTNSMVELFGQPATLQTTNGIAIRNRLLIVDLAAGKFIVPPGGYRIAGPTNMVNTNVFRVPKNRFFR